MIKPVFFHRTPDDRFLVSTVKHWDYRGGFSTAWMDDPRFGDTCLILDIDIIDQVFEFTNEPAALLKMAELYAMQLPPAWHEAFLITMRHIANRHGGT